MKKLTMVVVALIVCLSATAQRTIQLKDGNGKIIDEVVMVEWAKKSSMSISNYQITETVKRQDVKGRFRVQLIDMNALPDQSIQYRSNVAVYYSSTKDNFQLIDSGIGFTGFSFDAKREGFYVVKYANERELKSMILGIRKDEVDLYRPRPTNSKNRRI